MGVAFEILLGTLISTLLGYIVYILKTQSKGRADHNRGTMLLLKVQLIAYHEKWIERGFVTRHGLTNFTEMYDAYRSLGGNGMIEQLFEEIKTQPIKGEKYGK
ncbi:MAG: hypothetical protein FWE25_11115 [Lachnospiraceae bacterium]|nr:hypothetical protein [Lachnospiraceae bacterium]